METKEKRDGASAAARRSTRKQAARKPKTPPADAAVLLRFLEGPPLDIPIIWQADEILAYAGDWNRRLRDRRRWASRTAGVNALRDEALKFVEKLGLQTEFIERVGHARVVQVDLRPSDAPLDAALRMLPWEYLLANATRPIRGEAPFTVVRRLRSGNGRRSRSRPRQWLMSQCAPGVLNDLYDFTAECDTLERSALVAGAKLVRVKDPSIGSLRKKVNTGPFAVVHLAGFDIHQAADLGALKELPSAIAMREGYVLAGEGGVAQPVAAQPLAQLLCAGKGAPMLVTCNIHNSAYEIAQAMVREGAQSAIGFQDTFDDQLAEEFFATFFRAWPAAEFNSIAAFSYAWEQIRALKAPLQGSGLVLWTAQKLEDTQLISEHTIRQKTRQPIRLRDDNVRDMLQIDIEHIPELNYSILHNDGPLFSKFTIKKKHPLVGEVEDLHVDVELHVGTDSYPYRTTASLAYSRPEQDLSRQIRVSLASTLNRALRENVRTSLFVEVKWRDVTLHRKTYPVTLLSVDEWRDDDVNRKWLPSFVLPRDPVVPQIIERAQKYLMALLDDSSAGFDGYQSVDDDPGRKKPATACTGIDLQVRAIWSALIYDTPLSYINPPPTFTNSSQRLRTPSDVILGKRGTCIDLALLLASCLEYVEIYPAIILLKTHAFPAYWRHWAYHEAFGHASSSDAQSTTASDSAESELLTTGGQMYSWYFDRPHHFRQVMGEIQAGRLVPLETVLLTSRAGYNDAVAEGYNNLGNRREFDSMIDIQLARSDEYWRVTPLPILRSEA